MKKNDFDLETLLLLMEEIRLTTWDVKNPVNNGINDQPQLVTAGFLNHQQYGFRL